MSDFTKELERLINKHCKENESNTPDFILAEYLRNCLGAWNISVQERDKWYGFKPFDDGITTAPNPALTELKED